MTLSTRALKVISGVSAVAVCGVSGVLVATDPKPAAAPLRPPVSGASPKDASLVIPPSCGATGVARGGAAATLDPSLLPIALQLRQATTATQRRAILASLTASQRLEIEAYVRALRRPATSSPGSCEHPGAGSADSGSIAPSVIAAPASTQPLINTYVS
jgi:hypothetical protein